MKLSSLLFAAAAMVMLAGCSDDGSDGKGTITDYDPAQLSKSVYADPQAQGSFSFKAALDWKASAVETLAAKSTASSSYAPLWLHLDKVSGSPGNQTLTFTLDANYTGEQRTAIINLTCDLTMVRITVTQLTKNQDGSDPEKPNKGIYSYQDLFAFANDVKEENTSAIDENWIGPDGKVNLYENIRVYGIQMSAIGDSNGDFNYDFNGNGLTIHDISVYDAGDAGLFSKVPAGKTIESLNVSGSVTGNTFYTGGITGQNEGTIINCSFSGGVTTSPDGKTDNMTGGIAGYNNGTIEFCSVSGTVSGNQMAGGIAGNNNGTIEACTYKGSAGNSTEDNTAGGIAGQNTGTITGSRVAVNSKVSATDSAGGIVGYSGANGSITGCYSIATEINTTGSGSTNRGGIAGLISTYGIYSSTINTVFWKEISSLEDGIGSTSGTVTITDTDSFPTISDFYNTLDAMNRMNGAAGYDQAGAKYEWYTTSSGNYPQIREKQ